MLKNQNTMPSLIIGVDSSLRIIQWDPQEEKLTGAGFDQVMGMSLDDVIPEFETIFKYIDKALTEHS
ncbi:MAG: PAS domain-containing protein, partial [Spirochaetales bacterium]|nr:PAS domain-containing protein [Spirochaetales bacterium]